MSLLNVNKVAPQSGTDFTLGDSGDTFTVPSGATLTVAGTFTQTGAQTFDGGVDIDNFNINGTTITLSSGDMTLDVAGDIVLDADGGDVFVKDAGTTFGSLTNTSGNLIIKSGTTAALTFSGANVTAAGTIGSGAITSTGIVTGTAFTAGSAVLAEAELELLDGLTAGTAIASKVVTTDASIDTSGQRNLTISGELDAATGDFSGAVDIAGATTVAALTASGVGQIATLGIASAKDLGVGIHIRTADSGASVSNTADELVVEGSGDSGITILSGNSSNGRINFGDDGDNDIGSIDYDHNGNILKFISGGNAVCDMLANSIVFNEDSDDNDFRIETNSATHALFIDGGANKIGMNESAHNATRGLAINQAADDEAILLFYSSDVAHGITDIAETDTFGGIHKKSGTAGGIIIKGTSEGTIASTLQGICTTANTTKGTGGDAPIQLDGALKSGTGKAVVSSNGNILIVSNNGTCRFIVDAEGDTHSDGSAGTYDAYDDAQLVRAFDLSHGRGVIDSKFDKFVSYNHEKLAELKLVGREDDGTPNHFINTTGMQRLHNGAIWQQYEKHNQLLEAVYELAEKAVGKKEADAILDKHEVKRLN